MSSAFLEKLRRTWGLKTLGLRLVLSYVLLFVASTILLAVLAYALFTRFLREPDRAFMRAEAYEMAEAYRRGGVDALRFSLLGPSSDERRQDLIVRLTDERRQTLLLYNPDNWKPEEVSLLVRQPPPEDEAWLPLGRAVDEDALEAFALRLHDGRILQLGIDVDPREDAMESIQEVFLVIALPVFVLALLVGGVMAYRALLPIRRLVQTLHAITDTGDVKTRVPVEGARGEFADLIHLSNQMLDRIEALVAGLHETLDNVAHDLRTPVTRLRGRAELALQEDRDAETYREALVESLEASESVERVLETIMEVAEAEAGTMPLVPETLAADTLVGDVVELYRFVAEPRGLTLDARVAPGLTLYADRSRIRRVLANLVDNAVKYTPAGGRITVEAEPQGAFVAVRVRDTGPGIPPDEQPRIWDRLYRGDQSRSERGLGLGLSLVRAIVQAHGGHVEAESQTGRGATFTVLLPAERGSTPA